MKHAIVVCLLAIFLSSLLYSQAISAKAQYGPLIDKYGPVYKVSDMDVPLPKDHEYKVVFDVYQTATEPDVHSRRLESAARFLNMHALHGVAADKMHIAIVMHGKATKDILTDEAYQKQFQVGNPNRELIELLAEYGVQFYVCGQTTDFYKYKREDILPEIKIALSAMTQLEIYQSKNYALLP